MRVEDDVLRDEGAAEMMEWRWLLDLENESAIRGCCWGSGGGDEQGVMASSSSLKEALAVMERRPPVLWSRCDSAILCGLIWMLLGTGDEW